MALLAAHHILHVSRIRVNHVVVMAFYNLLFTMCETKLYLCPSILNLYEESYRQWPKHVAVIYIQNLPQFLSSFAEFRIATVSSSCLSVCPSVRMEQLECHWTDFNEILYLSIFRYSVEKIQVSLKSDKNERHFI